MVKIAWEKIDETNEQVVYGFVTPSKVEYPVYDATMIVDKVTKRYIISITAYAVTEVDYAEFRTQEDAELFLYRKLDDVLSIKKKEVEELQEIVNGIRSH